MKHFTTQKTVTFGEVDSLGIMYFARIFEMAHEAFEFFLEKSGFGWKNWFLQKNWIMPVRHAEANYLKPMLPGETYQVDVSIAKIGQTSFKVKTVFSSKSGMDEQIHAEVMIVHAFLERLTMQKSAIPEEIHRHISEYLR